MRISEILKRDVPSISFEFFPPKSEDLETLLFETIESLRDEKADFASVTFGAGGSSANKTIEWTKRIKVSCNITTMMHITCVGFQKNNIDYILDAVKAQGIENILALRGDPPKDKAIPAQPQFNYACDLVEYIANKNDFTIGVAGYPEGHPQCADMTKDLEHLKLKIDKGADFVITQLFFDNEAFYRYRDDLAKMKMDKPVIAGIMPIVNASQIIRFTNMCGAKIPPELLARIEKADEKDVMKIGVDYAVSQCEDLMANGVQGLHFYTLNRSKATKNVLEKIR